MTDLVDHAGNPAPVMRRHLEMICAQHLWNNGSDQDNREFLGLL